MNNETVGIFDSGIGGLTVLSKIVRTRIYAFHDIGFLVDNGALEIVIACGAVSTNAIEVLKDKFSFTDIRHRRTCGGVRDKEIDTLILGCTHYPIIEDNIPAVLPWCKARRSWY